MNEESERSRRQWWQEPEPGCGRTPAVILWNPKYGFNCGAAYRNCAAWGAEQLWIKGDRYEPDILQRLPREERMKVYKEEVALFRAERPFDYFAPDIVPVAIEVMPTAEVLTNDWLHPDNPVYVFGPEDGSLSGAVLAQCHRFVMLPARHCLNLANAVGSVLQHRMLQRIDLGLEPRRAAKDLLFEERE